jgi:fructuronate reductase
MERLHPDRLDALAPQVRTPAYDRRGMAAGIVHLGLGAFHRAHQAVYTEDAIEQAGGDWGIIGVSLRSDKMARQLNPQQGLYSVWSEDADGGELRVIGCVQQVLVAGQDLDAVVAAIASASTRLVTLTITEKGYLLAADGQSLAVDDDALAADLENPARPATAIGVLALGLKVRSEGSGAPLTVLSSDNLSANGSVLGKLLRDYLALTFPAVGPWLDAAVSFPCSMVDRIVPATTQAQKQRQAGALGLLDEGAVGTEPFSQWVVEDNFASDRPAWDAVGVQFVDDIQPYETIKLRLLNASHSAIAYCGLLAGKQTVDEVMADNVLRGYVAQLMAQDLAPALDAPAGFDLAAYREDLLARFGNPCLAHRCAQIAMDGSEKIRQRWLPTLQAAPAPYLRRALAAWCFFILETGADIADPRAAQLHAQRASGSGGRVPAVLACAGITPDTMADHGALCAEIERNVDILRSQGVQGLLGA